MIVYLANGTYVATQAEAKKLSRHFSSVEVPTSDGREKLCEWLNANPKTRPVEVTLTGTVPFEGFHGDAPDEPELMCEGVPFHLQTLEIIHVEEYINKAEHRVLAAILNAATWRLGELRKAGGVI